MVDVGPKAITRRFAHAVARVTLPGELAALLRDGEIATRKGPLFQTASLAGIMGAKRTADLVPLCHPMPITRVVVDFELDEAQSQVRCTAQVETLGRTGVEMEALTAVQVGLLTVYDMCKAVDRGMVMGDIRLLEKRGGKSGDWGVAG